MSLVPRIVSYCPSGQVLAIPESAVIDTGSRQVVYVERMPGMFDGVEVRLGPRSGESYPVVEGLEVGQAVAVAGAFLVDAETRLNPSLAAGYFGARRPEVAATKPEPPAEKSGLGGLAPTDRDLAIEQGICPVTGKKLGSMGTPVRFVARGRTVFLCCGGAKGPSKRAPINISPSSKRPRRPTTHDRPDHRVRDRSPRARHPREPGPGRARGPGDPRDPGRTRSPTSPRTA